MTPEVYQNWTAHELAQFGTDWLVQVNAEMRRVQQARSSMQIEVISDNETASSDEDTSSESSAPSEERPANAPTQRQTLLSSLANINGENLHSQ